MPTSYTPHLDLNLPEIGASRDTWGALLNANFSTLDQFVSMAMPVGTILDYCGSVAPSGYLIADGRLVSRVTYSALFAVLGTSFGAGDGTTTFALPNLNGRAAIGPGVIVDSVGNSMSLSFATVIGNIGNQILQTHLPNYAITSSTVAAHNHGGAAVGGSHTHAADTQGAHNHGTNTTTESTTHTHYATTDTQGSHAHSVYGGLFGGGSVNGMAFQANAQQGQYIGYTDNQGAHAHNVSVGTESAYHVHGINTDGAHIHNISASGNLSIPITADGSHSHTIYLGGSSTWFPVLQPVVVVTKIIYAGQQAAVVVMTDTAPLRVIEGESDELHAIREELAQLRSLLVLTRPQRVQRTPMRGSH